MYSYFGLYYTLVLLYVYAGDVMTLSSV